MHFHCSKLEKRRKWAHVCIIPGTTNICQLKVNTEQISIFVSLSRNVRMAETGSRLTGNMMWVIEPLCHLQMNKSLRV